MENDVKPVDTVRFLRRDIIAMAIIAVLSFAGAIINGENLLADVTDGLFVTAFAWCGWFTFLWLVNMFRGLFKKRSG